MRATLRRIRTDLRQRRNLDLYATALVALVFLALTIVGADLPDDLRWSLLFAALGLLVLRAAIPAWGSAARGEVLLDRAAFARNPIDERLRRARQVWIFAPTGQNFLSHERCELIRKGPLALRDGDVRIVVLDNSDAEQFAVVARQLDRLFEYPLQQISDLLQQAHRRLSNMAGWKVHGTFEYRTLEFSPGFSIVAVDPSSRDGLLIVEFHGFRKDTAASRMHLELTNGQDHPWYEYWLGQFDAIWQEAARQPDAHPGPPAGLDPVAHGSNQS